MTEYKPPLNDIRLVLNEISDISRLCDLPGFEHVDVETIDGVLEELGRFAAEVISPVNKIGDQEGCSVSDGVVTMPEEFGEACAFLCSLQAGYITGQNLLLDGGVFDSAF